MIEICDDKIIDLVIEHELFEIIVSLLREIKINRTTILVINNIFNLLTSSLISKASLHRLF